MTASRQHQVGVELPVEVGARRLGDGSGPEAAGEVHRRPQRGPPREEAHHGLFVGEVDSGNEIHGGAGGQLGPPADRQVADGAGTGECPDHRLSERPRAPRDHDVPSLEPERHGRIIPESP